jgi:hypothetical protein
MQAIFLISNEELYSLTSISIPEGRSNFIKESIVFDDGS